MTKLSVCFLCHGGDAAGFACRVRCSSSKLGRSHVRDRPRLIQSKLTKEVEVPRTWSRENLFVVTFDARSVPRGKIRP